jgi:hypothetical protein
MTLGLSRRELLSHAAVAVAMAFVMASLLVDWDKTRLGALSGASARPVIGRLEQVGKEVRLRPADMPVWDDAWQGIELRQRDSVFTGPASTATVVFDDGTALEVAERSLVIVERHAETARFEVKRGIVEGRTEKGSGRRLEVKLAGESRTLTVDGGRVQIDAAQDGGAAVTVLAGAAKIAGKAGELVTLGENQRSEVRRDGKMSTPRTLPVTLRSPAPGAKLERSRGAVSFAWGLGAPDQPNVVFEVAKGASFGTTAARRQGAGLRAATVELPPGLYFWRVTVGAELSEVRRLMVVDDAPPVLLRPARDAAFVASTVTLDWQGHDDGRRYLIELAQDAGFARLVKKSDVARPPLAVADLEPGRYFWRVRSGAASETRSFTLLSPPLPAAPKLVAPADGAVLTASGAAPEVRLQWEELGGVSGYVVEVSDDPGFAHEVEVARPMRSGFAFKPREPKTFHWRLRSMDDFGRQAAYSAPRSFQLKAAPPELVYPAPAGRVSIAQNARPTFSWKATWRAPSYVLELAKDAAFRDRIVEETTKATRFEWKDPEPGSYYWRVRTEDGRASEARRVDLVLTAMLKPPVLAPEYVAPLGGGGE